MKYFKLLILPIALVGAMGFTTTPAMAETTSHSMCANASDAGEMIMKMRQAGFPMSKIMKIVDTFDSSTESDRAINRMYEQFVIAAYNEPRYSTDKYKHRAIVEFGIISIGLAWRCIKMKYLTLLLLTITLTACAGLDLDSGPSTQKHVGHTSFSSNGVWCTSDTYRNTETGELYTRSSCL